MIVAGPEGFRKNQYRKFNIRSAELTPGDDYGMMREVLGRRFKRLIAEAPRAAPASARRRGGGGGAAHGRRRQLPTVPDEPESPWPDLVLIDGGQGQLNAARADARRTLGIDDVPLVAIAKGPDRDAGRETFFMPGRDRSSCRRAIRCSISSQRLRDEAHRFAVGSHRQRRKRDIREAGLQEIAGIGPTRKRALLRSLRHAEGDRTRLARRS